MGEQGNGEDWRYAGSGVFLGSGNAVLWYRPQNSRNYRLISGQLTVRPATVDQLPKVPSVPLVQPTTRRAFPGFSSSRPVTSGCRYASTPFSVISAETRSDGVTSKAGLKHFTPAGAVRFPKASVISSSLRCSIGIWVPVASFGSMLLVGAAT